MPETEAPETIRSALAYFQRGGLVEMTERTLAEMAAGRTVVECDADGVLALCSLAAEAMVARAGRADDDALIDLPELMMEAFYDDGLGCIVRHADQMMAAMTRVLAVVREHDAPTLATLRASLAEAEARAATLAAERDEAIRRRDAWRDKAAGYDEMAAAVRSKAKEAGPSIARALLRGALVEAEARAGRAEAALERMREALEPFVEFTKAGSFDRLPDGMPMTQGSSLAFRQVTAGDFKRARAALQEPPHGR